LRRISGSACRTSSTGSPCRSSCPIDAAPLAPSSSFALLGLGMAPHDRPGQVFGWMVFWAFADACGNVPLAGAMGPVLGSISGVPRSTTKVGSIDWEEEGGRPAGALPCCARRRRCRPGPCGWASLPRCG
jgi:hypothetical protein